LNSINYYNLIIIPLTEILHPPLKANDQLLQPKTDWYFNSEVNTELIKFKPWPIESLFTLQRCVIWQKSVLEFLSTQNNFIWKGLLYVPQISVHYLHRAILFFTLINFHHRFHLKKELNDSGFASLCLDLGQLATGSKLDRSKVDPTEIVRPIVN
jgi:hypothetical protein